jgi:hypothetical protein
VARLEAFYRPFTTIGIILIACGALLVLLPFLARYFPDLEGIPWLILWIYKSDGFYFATSPLLIIFSLLSILAQIVWKK